MKIDTNKYDLINWNALSVAEREAFDSYEVEELEISSFFRTQNNAVYCVLDFELLDGFKYPYWQGIYAWTNNCAVLVHIDKSMDSAQVAYV